MDEYLNIVSMSKQSFFTIQPYNWALVMLKKYINSLVLSIGTIYHSKKTKDNHLACKISSVKEDKFPFRIPFSFA